MRAGALAAFVFFLPLVGALLSGATPPGPDDAVLDDFNDGNYTGGLAAWTVQAGSWSASSLELRNQPTASTNYRISTPQAQAQGSWQWSFRHNASAGLNDVMRFHFMQSGSSDAELSSGYYVFSNTANNFYKLIRWSGGVATDLIATTQALGTSWHTARVDRGVGGGFAFYYGASLVGTLIDDTFLTTSYLGVRNSAGSTDDWVAIDDIQFTASTATPPTVTVNAPNGGETWYQKGSYPITWSTAQGTNPLKASPINIFYGTGVNGPWTLLAGPLADTGSWTWNVPSAFVAGSYYIRVRAEDNAAAPNVGYDRSDAAFTIAAPTAPSVTVTKPTGGESLTAQAQYGIQYTASQGTFPLAANPIAIDYSTDGGTTWLPIVSGQANSGTYTWAVPNTVVSNAIIRVCANDDRSPATTGCGQVTFNIVAATPPSATVQQPNGGETWGLNGTYQIKWAASAGSFPLATNPFTVFVSITGLAGPWTTLASGLSALTYNWLVNVTTSNDSYIRVCAKDDRPVPNTGCDAGDAPFSVVSALPPTVTVAAPNGGENLVVGSQFVIRWNATPGTHPLKTDPIRIHFSQNGTGGPWAQVVLDIANSGSYSWTVPANLTCSAAIRVRAFDDQGVPNIGTDVSDSTFCIVLGNGAPQVSLLSPAAGAMLRGQAKIEWDGSDVNGDIVAYKVQTSTDGGATWVDRAVASHKEGSAPTRRNLSLDTTLIQDRTGYLFRVNASDPNGSSSSSQVSNITVDNAPPSSAPDNMTSWVKTPAFNVGWKGSDATSGVMHYDVLVSVNGSAASPWLTGTSTTSKPYNGTDGGIYKFTFIATDRAGNKETKSKEDITVTVDSKPPVTKVGPLPPFVDLAAFDVPYTENDPPSQGPVTVELFYRSPSVASWTSVGKFNSSPGRFAPSETGLHEFQCVGTDAAGNKETKPAAKEAETFVDGAAPVPSVTTSVGLTNKDPVTITVSAHDNEALAEMRIYQWTSPDNQSYTTSKQVWSKSLTGGPKDHSEPVPIALGSDAYHRLEAYAVDLAGKESRGAFTYVRLDTKAPTVVNADPAGPGAPTDAHVRILFDESMQTMTVESAVKIEGTAVPPSSGAWSPDGRLYEFDLKGLGGNTTIKVSIGATALDLAGNALAPHEFSFTTIPTTGAIAGKVSDTRKQGIAGATVLARGPAGEKSVQTGPDGTYIIPDLAPGTYELFVSSDGFKPAVGQATVETAKTAPADFILETELTLANIALYSIAGIVPLVLLLGAVVLLRRRSRCPNCKNKLRNGRCGNCGYVRAGETKKAAGPVGATGSAKRTPPTLKTVGRKVGSGSSTVTAGATGAPPHGMNVPLLEPVDQVKHADKCVACGAVIPIGEDWCPKCGQAASQPDEETSLCPRCGGGMLEGTCLLCGFTVGGPPEVSEESGMERPEAKCPRCMAPLTGGARFCDACGTDILKIRMGKDPPPAAAAKVVPAPPPRAALPPAPLSTPAPSPMTRPEPQPGTLPPAGPAPGAQGARTYCRTCGTPAPPDLPICDVCGEPLGR